MATPIKFIKASEIPATWLADALYFIKNNGYAETYVTGSDGTPEEVGNTTMIEEIAGAMPSVKFGVEDTTSDVNRSMDMQLHDLHISNGADVFIGSTGSNNVFHGIHITPGFVDLYADQGISPDNISTRLKLTPAAATIIKTGKPESNIAVAGDNVSLFTNDAGYLMLATLPPYPVVPANVSAFTNDAGYLTLITLPAYPTVPTNISAFNNDAGYLTLATTPAITGSVGVNLDGQGSVLTTGQKGYVRVPFAGTITEWSIISDTSGSCVFDIWKAAGFPTAANSITGSLKPTLSGATTATSTVLTGWTRAVAKGDIIGWNLDSVATITRAILQLTILKS